MLQLHGGGRYTPRVTVRTAAGEATGKLRAVDADRLIFGDRARHPIVVPRAEICEVSTSRHLVRPRTEAISMAIGGSLIAAIAAAPAKGVGILVRVVVALGLGSLLASTTTRPARLLYSHPEACVP